MTAVIMYSAGNNNRFGSIKCLTPYNGKTVLEHNVEMLRLVFDTIYVVVGIADLHKYPNIPNVEYITILPGGGCGRCVLRSLELLPLDFAVVMWSDVLLTVDNLSDIEYLANSCPEPLVFPVVFKNSPYVKVHLNDNQAMFADLEPPSGFGWTDCCMFKIDTEQVRFALHMLEYATLQLNGDYNTPTKELKFLYVLNTLRNLGTAAEVFRVEHQVHSFNTPEEFKSITEKLNDYSTIA